MTNALDILGHRVTVTQIPGTQYIDTRQNVKKRLSRFRFTESIPDGDINILYASAEPANADLNLFISDKSALINENSPNFIIDEATFLGPSYTTFFKNFLLTDTFTPETATRPSEPLYFRHVLPPEIDENSVSILDKNFAAIDGNLYVIEKPLDFNDDDGLPMDGSDINHPLRYQGVYVYNNLQNIFDENTGEYTVYYISYADNDGNAVNVILNNEDVFHVAEFEDIFQLTAEIKPWVKAYSVEESNGLFTITVPLSTTYAINTLDTARIFVTPPINKTADLPWFPNISNGSFKHIDGSQTYLYDLPEFSSQSFSPFYPFKIIIREEVTRITDHLIKLNRQNISIDPLNNMHMEIEIFDSEENILSAITTDPDRHGDTYINDSGIGTDVAWASDLIHSTDLKDGFVYLIPTVQDTYRIYVTYYFKEKFYEFTQINFNPTQNNDILNQRIIIYLVPENASNNSNTGHPISIHYLVVDVDGAIIYSSQDGTTGNPNLVTGKYMIQAADRRSLTPGGISHVFWVNAPVGQDMAMGMYFDALPDFASGAGNSLVDNGAGISHIFRVFPFGQISKETFVDTFTVEAADGKPGLDRRYLVLAELFVNEHTAPEDITILDTRVKGGGIKESRINEALLINPEVQWYNDIGIFDGRPYPGTSVVIIKIPYVVLKEYGGLLTKAQVQQVVKRHLALGSAPIIRYYGPQPYFTAIESGDQQLTVSWDSEGPDYGYNLYISAHKNGPFTKVNTTLISDNPLGNTYTVGGLDNKIAYHVTGTAVNIYTNIEGPRSTAIVGRATIIKKRINEPLGHQVTIII